MGSNGDQGQQEALPCSGGWVRQPFTALLSTGGCKKHQKASKGCVMGCLEDLLSSPCGLAVTSWGRRTHTREVFAAVLATPEHLGRIQHGDLKK